MLEYLLTIVLIIGSLLFIVRFTFQKSTKTKSENERVFGKWIPVSFETPRPLPYRPFKYEPNYFITMGIGRLDWYDWIELDNRWTRYHQEKLSRLCKTTPEAYDAALETWNYFQNI